LKENHKRKMNNRVVPRESKTSKRKRIGGVEEENTFKKKGDKKKNQKKNLALVLLKNTGEYIVL